jgi:hypothetical protein
VTPKKFGTAPPRRDAFGSDHGVVEQARAVDVGFGGELPKRQ